MKIQIITEQKIARSAQNITQSPFATPRSLDEFDVNIIDLSCESLWYNVGDNIRNIDKLDDFLSIQTMVMKKKKAKIIFVFPKNIYFHYCYSYNSAAEQYEYKKRKFIKYAIQQIYSDIIAYILPQGITGIQVFFEPTETTIGPYKLTADFHFETAYPALTKSCYSEKMTTIKISDEEIYITALNITSSNDLLMCFLNYMFNDIKKSVAPEWMTDIRFDDDVNQAAIIEDISNNIKTEQDRIRLAQSKLEQNARYKSILYTNGNELVEVVFNILEQLLDCDLSKFIDERKEDFLIQKASCTFIGEIKGVTSNVKNEHISQVDVHYQGYMDKLAEERRQENVHQLLIINPFRTKPLTEREPVNEQQITLAQRNGCLIIETSTLLHIYEMFCQSQISSEQCINIFASQIGLLKESDFSINVENIDSFKV